MRDIFGHEVQYFLLSILAQISIFLLQPQQQFMEPVLDGVLGPAAQHGCYLRPLLPMFSDLPHQLLLLLGSPILPA